MLLSLLEENSVCLVYPSSVVVTVGRSELNSLAGRAIWSLTIARKF